MDNPRKRAIRKAFPDRVKKGNQQPLVTARMLGGLWYRTDNGRLVNIELAQEIQHLEVDGKYQVIVAYNDYSEVVLTTMDNEKDAIAHVNAIGSALSDAFKRDPNPMHPSGDFV